MLKGFSQLKKTGGSCRLASSSHSLSAARSVGPQTALVCSSAQPTSRRTFYLAAFSTLSSFSATGLPAVARDISMSASAGETPSTPSSHDLLVVGPGVLGGQLGRLWHEQYPEAAVLGLTNTTNSHDRLSQLGLAPHTKDTLPARKFAYVAFAAPPSGSSDYAAEVKNALSYWDGTGSFVFTSSMSVCSVDDGSEVTEECPLVTVGAGPSTDRLLLAEQAVLQGGGNVVRLVGLYHTTRGAHTFFYKVKEVARHGDYLVNLLHYEDAASLSAAVLRGDGAGPYRGRGFLGCDNHPTSFKDMMEACDASGAFPGQGPVTFTAQELTSKSKRANNEQTRKELGWQPKYESFAAFMQSGAKDIYNP